MLPVVSRPAAAWWSATLQRSRRGGLRRHPSAGFQRHSRPRLCMATNLRAAGVELQLSRNDVQGRRVVSVVAAEQIRKTPSVTASICQ